MPRMLRRVVFHGSVFFQHEKMEVFFLGWKTLTFFFWLGELNREKVTLVFRSRKCLGFSTFREVAAIFPRLIGGETALVSNWIDGKMKDGPVGCILLTANLQPPQQKDILFQNETI